MSDSSLAQTERQCKERFCRSVGGIIERRYTYDEGHIFVDCDTKKIVYEGVLDKRISLDSIQQAELAGHVTGKKEAIVVYDTDGREGAYESLIKKAIERYGIKYVSYRCTC